MPSDEPKIIPQEVLRLQSLLLDNWWKMVKERMEKDIKEINRSCRLPKPLWMTAQEELVRYADLEVLKQRASAYEYAINLPYEIMKEYWEDGFEQDRSGEL